MVEKKSELRRKRSRQQKMAKLKDKLGKAKTNTERDGVLKKIHRISPWWKEPAPAKPAGAK
jgi:hypothetical protein